MSVSWYGDSVLAAVRAATVQGLQRGVEAVKTEAVSLILNTPKSGRWYGKHQASAPGEAPASDTGDLVAKIGSAVDAPSLTGSIEFYSAHAAFLEYGTSRMAPRPFARVSVVNKRDEISADIADEIGKVLR